MPKPLFQGIVDNIVVKNNTQRGNNHCNKTFRAVLLDND